MEISKEEINETYDYLLAIQRLMYHIDLEVMTYGIKHAHEDLDFVVTKLRRISDELKIRDMSFRTPIRDSLNREKID